MNVKLEAKMAEYLQGSLGFSGKVDVPGEHGRDAGDLLLLVHHEVPGGVGLEVEGHFPGDPGQVGQEIPGGAETLENVAQGLKIRQKINTDNRKA